ncbi:DNA ligase 4 [Sergentomyia squamirostris]
MAEKKDDRSSCISQGIKFSTVIKLLENMIGAKTPKNKENLLKKFLNTFHEFRANAEKEKKIQNVSFYPVLRLLLPECDHNRGSYGIKQTTMGRLYVSVLGLDKRSQDAKTLIEGRSPSGDYADIVFSVMEARSKKESSITVFDVNQGLDSIANYFKNGHSKKIDDILIKFISEMTALEQKWLVRMILKKLPLRFGLKSILNTIHPQANQVYSRTSNLSAVCEITETGDTVQIQEENLVKVFNHVKPMLLARINLQVLQQTLASGEFFIETKMDGERFQIHRSGAEYRFFSRNSKDYTNKFEAIVYSLNQLIAPNVQNIIIDGEMMVWNRDEQNFYTKGDHFDVKNLQSSDPKLCPVFCVYDIIILNGQDLTRKPYAERRRLLNTVVKEKKGVLEIVGYKKIENVEHVLKCLNEAIDEGEEGIVIKSLQSYYCPGEREQQNGWFKIKPDYINGVVSDLDLLIIGGFYDRHKRHVKSYLVGVYANGPGEKEDAIFYAVGKVSGRGGLTFNDRCRLKQELEGKWKPVEFAKGSKKSAIAPKNIEWNNAVPDVWLEPSQSKVLVVRAAELNKTDTFRTTHALKFPRISSWHEDKLWYDACSLAEFEELCGKDGTGVRKLTKRHLRPDDLAKVEKPTKRIKNTALTLNFRRHLPEEERVSSICENLAFCILSTAKNMPSIEELRELILKHGGNIVENPGPSTFAIIAGDLTLNVKKYAERRQYNIVKVEWVVKHLGNGKIPPKFPQFHPKYMISTTKELEVEFVKTFDEYGDSYTTPIDSETLKELLRDMVLDRSERLLKREKLALLEELNKQPLP